ncbi:hypothetical protein [Amycolatopsis sp. NPDC004378]
MTEPWARAMSALHDDGDLLAARALFDDAFRRAERSGDAVATARAALGLGGLWVHEHPTATAREVTMSRLRHALTVAGPGSVLAVRLRVRLAAERARRHGDAAGDLLPLLTEARRTGDAVALVEALILAHHGVPGPQHGGLRRTLAAELAGESVRTGRRGDLLTGLLWQVVDRIRDADPQAERLLDELRAELTRRDHLAVGLAVSAIDAMFAVRAGRFAAAESLARASAARATAAGVVDAAGWFGVQLFAIRRYQGRLPELLPSLRRLARSNAFTADDEAYLAALAVTAAAAGEHRTAEAALAKLGDPAGLPRTGAWLFTLCCVTEGAHALHDAELASAVYALLRPHGDLPVVAGFGAVCLGSVEHVLGMAAATSGDLDAAAGHLRTAVRRNLALGHWPAVVLSRLAHARVLALRADPADVPATREEHEAAVRDADALGMPTPGAPPRVSMTSTRGGWRIELGPHVVIVPGCIGLRHLATLTANPGREVAALGLAGAETVPEADHPVLDATAVRQYRHRLAQLGDAPTAEREWLTAELARATGLGGRARQFPGNAERARIAVGKAIRRALTRVTEADPTIGAHLRGTVHTGRWCWYRPA